MENLETHRPKHTGIDFSADFHEGRSGDAVAESQEQLKELGYYNGKIDGIFGSLTARAVIDFQGDYKLEPDGILGPITKSKMEEVISSHEIFHIGISHVEVKTVQRQLNVLGLYSANIDGIFGPITDSGVKNFQKNNGLMEDGTVGLETKKALRHNLLAEDFPKDMGRHEETKPATVKTQAGGNVYVIAEQLKQLGWVNVTDEMIRDLNHCLEDIRSTTPTGSVILSASAVANRAWENGPRKLPMDQPMKAEEIWGMCIQGTGESTKAPVLFN